MPAHANSTVRCPPAAGGPAEELERAAPDSCMRGLGGMIGVDASGEAGTVLLE